MGKFREKHFSHLSPQVVYDVVRDIESYPQYIPFCHASQILSDSDGIQVARLVFRLGPKEIAFTTRNTLKPNRQISMNLVEGPFDKLEGEWNFIPRADGTEVECFLHFQFSNPANALIFRLIWPTMLHALFKAFIERARRLSQECIEDGT